MRRRKDSVESHCYCNYNHLRMVMQSFIHLERSSELEIFKKKKENAIQLAMASKEKEEK
jgi:hypothetical protein